jgi:hypothetical protein
MSEQDTQPVAPKKAINLDDPREGALQLFPDLVAALHYHEEAGIGTRDHSELLAAAKVVRVMLLEEPKEPIHLACPPSMHTHLWCAADKVEESRYSTEIEHVTCPECLRRALKMLRRLRDAVKE